MSVLSSEVGKYRRNLNFLLSSTTQEDKRDGKFYGEHVKKEDVGMRVNAVDVAVPFITAMKKTHHDFMVRCKREITFSAEEMMKSETLPRPKINRMTRSEIILQEKNLTSCMYQSFLKLKEFTKSSEVLLYIVSKERNELVLCPNHIYSFEHRIVIKVGLNTTLAAYVAYTEEYVVTDDVLKDGRFPQGLGYLSICNKAAICMPVKSSAGDMIAVILLSRSCEMPSYDKRDELATLCLAKWMGASIGITTDIKFFLDRHQFFGYIKHLIIYYMSSGGDALFECVITNIMTFTELFFRAGKSRLYIVYQVEEDRVMTYRLVIYSKPNLEEVFIKTDIESFKVTRSVAQVAMKEKICLNLAGSEANQYEPWFDDDLFKSIICQPIISYKGQILGAIELYDKFKEAKFSVQDEEILVTLSKYLSIFLKFFRQAMKKKTLKSKIGLYTNMLSYHMKPCQCLTSKFSEHIEIPEDLFEFGFFPKDRRVEYLAKLCEVMLTKVLGTCHFPDLNLPDMLLTLAKAYDNSVSFTNFLHVFTVFHMCAVIVKKHQSLFFKNQQEYVLLAALLHCFGVKELNRKFSKGYDMLSFACHYINMFFKKFNLMDKERSLWVNMLSSACTDRNVRRFHERLCYLIINNSFMWNDELHRFSALALLMRVCEDAMWYKPFHYVAFMSKKLLTQIREEQKYQERCRNRERRKKGKRKLNAKKGKLMSGKEFIEKQIYDIKTKCLPNIEILSYLLPDASPLLDYACQTMEQWELISKSEDCWLWEQEMSRPPINDEDREVNFSVIDFFIKDNQ